MQKVFAALLFCTGLFCLAQAQVPMTGAGKGTPGSTAAYQGPGDVFASATVWYSCSTAYTSAFAAGTPNICDLNAVVGGASVCTLKLANTGKVDLSAYCAGAVTPATACALVTSCVVSKMYDQSGGTNHFIQAVAADNPPIVFNDTGGLPALNCTSGTPNVLNSTSNITINQPLTMSTVAKRTAGTVSTGAIGQNSIANIGFGAGTNNAGLYGGTAVSVAATDNAYHSINGLLSGANCALNVDGSDTASLNCGTNGISNAGVFQICRGNSFLSGHVTEVGMWSKTSTATDRNNISAVQHTNYGF